MSRLTWEVESLKYSNTKYSYENKNMTFKTFYFIIYLWLSFWLEKNSGTMLIWSQVGLNK